MKTSHHFLTVNQAHLIWTALRVLIFLFTFTAHTYTVSNSIAQDASNDPEALRGEYVQYSAHGFPTVVVGDVQSMVSLTYTHYLDSHPAIAFFHQQNKNRQIALVLGPPATSEQVGGNDRILLANRHFNDFLIDLGIAASPEPELRPTINSRTSGIVTLNNRGKGIFVIKEEGDYEIWCRNTIDPEGHKNKKFLRVDNMHFALPFTDKVDAPESSYKWLKVADVKLQGKEYIVNTLNKELEDLNSCHMPEIIIMSKDKLNEDTSKLSDKPISYLYYIDTDKAEKITKLSRNFSVTRNPFSLAANSFFIPKNSECHIKAYIKPKKTFIDSEDSVNVAVCNGSSVSKDAITGWNVHSGNVSYTQSLSEEGLGIKAYFEKSANIREEVVLTKEFPHIQLHEKRYLLVSCLLEDPGIQDLALNIWLEDEERDMASRPLTLNIQDKIDCANIYEEAKKLFGKSVVKHLYVKKMELILRKKSTQEKRHAVWFRSTEWVDATKEDTKGPYMFTLKNVVLLNHEPMIARLENENMQSACSSPEYLYYFDKQGTLNHVRFPEEIPSYVKNVFRSNIRKFMDLKKTPVFLLSFNNPNYETEAEGIEAKWFPRKFKVFLGLDFDGDGKEDSQVKLLLPAAPAKDGNLYINIRANDTVSKRFPGKSHYNLLRVGIAHPADDFVLTQNLITRETVRCEEYTCLPSDFDTGSAVLKLDNKEYTLPDDYKKNEIYSPFYCIEYNRLALNKGNHLIEVSDNKKLKVHAIVIEPTVNAQMPVTVRRVPTVDFRRVNPTKYIINVNGATEPFILVFNQTFHNKWKLFMHERPVAVNLETEKDPAQKLQLALWSTWKDRGNKIEVGDHFVANGYANAWIIPPLQDLRIGGQETAPGKENTERDHFQMVLEFKPQALYEAGLIVSTVTLLGCLSYLVYNKVRRRKSLANET